MRGPQSSGRGGERAFSEHLLANEAKRVFIHSSEDPLAL